jgi:hypothetical protein
VSTAAAPYAYRPVTAGITQIVIWVEEPRCVTTRLGVRLGAIERSKSATSEPVTKVNPRHATRLKLSNRALLMVKKSADRLLMHPSVESPLGCELLD